MGDDTHAVIGQFEGVVDTPVVVRVPVAQDQVSPLPRVNAEGKDVVREGTPRQPEVEQVREAALARVDLDLEADAVLGDRGCKCLVEVFDQATATDAVIGRLRQEHVYPVLNEDRHDDSVSFEHRASFPAAPARWQSGHQ
jgi:hypothetical protein